VEDWGTSTTRPFLVFLIKSQPSETGEGKKGNSNWGKREREANRIESSRGEALETGRRAAESAPAPGMEDLSVEDLASNLSTYKEQLREVSSPPLSSIWPRPFSVLAAILLERSF